MQALLPWLISLASAYDDHATCEDAPPLAAQVLDAFEGTLDGMRPEQWEEQESTAELTSASVRVDHTWSGQVVPELRGETSRTVRRRLGPPALHVNDRSGWPVTYGCLVLETTDESVTGVIVFHLPCSAALSDPEEQPPNSSARW
ncbi:MAG: hypothetical protein KC912_16845 [Proteobacteria bacterium]|nr:hypothetical protein [Pseudomonadota bacterium]